MRSCLIYNGIFMPQSGVSLRGVATEDTCSVLSDSIAVHGTSQLMSIPIAHHDSSQEMENSGKKNVHFQINSNTTAELLAFLSHSGCALLRFCLCMTCLRPSHLMKDALSCWISSHTASGCSAWRLLLEHFHFCIFSLRLNLFPCRLPLQLW